MAGMPVGSRMRAGDLEDLDDRAGRGAYDMRRRRVSVFVTVDDHAAAQAERRDQNDGKQQYLFHGSSSRIYGPYICSHR